MTQLETYEGKYLWKYIPSVPVAAVFIVLFFAITSVHCYQLFKSRAWFCISFTLGGLFELIGYIGRIIAHGQTGNLAIYVLQSVFILVAPALFAASIYMALGRLIRSVHDQKASIVPVRWLTIVFVIGDIFSFVVQARGASLLANGGDQAQAGQYIIIAGLGVQVVMFGLFAVTALLWHLSVNRVPAPQGFQAKDVPWKGTLGVLYAVSAMDHDQIRLSCRGVCFRPGWLSLVA
ncbi:hypothetical protein MMC09_006227 [Bachmanniomyces sp. S44760]|nr:hypothetical protein [Bachmanniomyces sp. S44760]